MRGVCAAGVAGAAGRLHYRGSFSAARWWASCAALVAAGMISAVAKAKARLAAIAAMIWAALFIVERPYGHVVRRGVVCLAGWCVSALGVELDRHGGGGV